MTGLKKQEESIPDRLWVGESALEGLEACSGRKSHKNRKTLEMPEDKEPARRSEESGLIWKNFKTTT